MSTDQIFVALVCAILSVASLVAAAGRWTAAYRLRLASLIRSRFGKKAAQSYYGLLSILLAAAAIAIALGWRPAYVAP